MFDFRPDETLTEEQQMVRRASAPLSPESEPHSHGVLWVLS